MDKHPGQRDPYSVPTGRMNRKLAGVSGIIHASGPRPDLPIPGTRVFRATDFVAFSDCIS
jgi:hypothetical protein